MISTCLPPYVLPESFGGYSWGEVLGVRMERPVVSLQIGLLLPGYDHTLACYILHLLFRMVVYQSYVEFIGTTKQVFHVCPVRIVGLLLEPFQSLHVLYQLRGCEVIVVCEPDILTWQIVKQLLWVTLTMY